jgi:uncharacterized RDD family membrane protein YckC
MESGSTDREPRSWPHAEFLSRVVARVIDGAMCLFVLTTLASFIALATSEVAFYPVLFGTLLIYFGIGPLTGGTLGERAMSLRVVDARRDQPPGIIQSAVRSLTTTALIASGAAIFMLAFNDEPNTGYTDTDLWIFGAMAAVFVVSILARLWMLFGRQHRTLTDRLEGVVVVQRTTRAPHAAISRHGRSSRRRRRRSCWRGWRS